MSPPPNPTRNFDVCGRQPCLKTAPIVRPVQFATHEELAKDVTSRHLQEGFFVRANLLEV